MSSNIKRLVLPSTILSVLLLMTFFTNSIFVQVASSVENGVKITYPGKGQQVPVGSNLTVIGESTDNATSDNCQVSVIVNNVKPYQPATGKATGRENDYSTWNFLLTPKYTAIKQGMNKITAKLSCLATPANLTKWYSLNVTGVIGNDQNRTQVSLLHQSEANKTTGMREGSNITFPDNKTPEVAAANKSSSESLRSPSVLSTPSLLPELRPGDNKDEILLGNRENDYVTGGNGDDEIQAKAGEDYISGGNGDDILQGNEENDFISGDNGDDDLIGDDGDDTLDGGNGKDSFDCGGGQDTITDFNPDKDAKLDNCEHF